MRYRKKTRRANTKRKIGSIAFFLAIPVNLLIAFLCFVVLRRLIALTITERDLWALFAAGFVGGFGIVYNMRLPRLRTLVHEMKHAIVVVLSGNRISAMEVHKHTGHVDYEMYKNTLRFAPFIALAPYFFPLFSLPVLIAAVIYEADYRGPFVLLLGLAAAVDITMGYQEWHPNQTDLKRMFGGFVSAWLFVVGFDLMWILFLLLWVVGGRESYIYLGYAFWGLAKVILAHIRASNS